MNLPYVRIALVAAALLSARDQFVIAQDAGATAPAPAAELRFVVPPRLFAVVGQPLTIYVDNVILTQTPEKYRLDVAREADGKREALGSREARFWKFIPEASHVGRHPLRIALSEEKNDQPQELASTKSELVVAPADSFRDQKLSLLIVGDSLTHASLYPNSLAKLLSQPGNPPWTMLGTHRPASVAAGVAHEGYGGWTWERFCNHYIPNSEGADARLRGSPFVFADDKGQPSLDPAKYFDKHFSGQRPDVIVFLLGINDCFSAPPDDPAKMDERIDQVFKHAERLLAAMRAAAPHADLVVGITTPPNSRQEAFVANYQDRYTRWGWKRIQHRLVERQIRQFAGREKEQVYLIPTELNVDPVDGYPVNNGVHPNAVGYQQIAESIYAWLKCR